MNTPYKEAFPIGTRVRIVSRASLEEFARDWKYHHQLEHEQMEYAGAAAIVRQVGFYHGGDPLYALENVPGLWHESCLEAAVQG
jgi:hypothetical protein